MCSQSGYSRVFMGLFKVIAYILAFTTATTHTQLCLNLPLTVGLLCLFFRADRASRNGAAWLILNLLQSQVASIPCRRQLPPSCAVNAVRWWAVRSTNRARLLKKIFSASRVSSFILQCPKTTRAIAFCGIVSCQFVCLYRRQMAQTRLPFRAEGSFVCVQASQTLPIRLR